MNPYVINIANGNILEDARYGSVVAFDQAGIVPLHKLDLAFAKVRPGATSPAHYHATFEEAYMITRGEGTVTIDDVTSAIKPGHLIRIPRLAVHSLTAGSDGVEFWVACGPRYDANDDIETDAVKVEKPVTYSAANGTAVKIALIIGTHRAGSLSAKIARQIARMYSELGVAVDLIDLAELPRSIFDPESFTQRYATDSLLAQRLIAANGVVFVTPEYNGSFPGVLKHVMDIQNYERCFGGKAACLVGVAAGDFGAVRALDHLGAVLGYRSANIFGRKTYIRNVDESPMDENGHLTDPAIVRRLREQVKGFVEFVRCLAPR